MGTSEDSELQKEHDKSEGIQSHRSIQKEFKLKIDCFKKES